MLPLLEDVVSSDYPLWRPAGALVAGARPDGQAAAASTGAASGRSVSQNMGQGGVSTGVGGAGALACKEQEAVQLVWLILVLLSGEFTCIYFFSAAAYTPQVDTLARAYAFLMECGEMSWQQLEEKAMRPYTCEGAGWWRWCLVGGGRGAAEGDLQGVAENASGMQRPQPGVCAQSSLASLLALQPQRRSGSCPTACTAALGYRSLPTPCRQATAALLGLAVVAGPFPGLLCYRVYGVPTHHHCLPHLLQHVSNLSLPDPRTRMWLLRHWLLCLLDRSKKFKIGARLPCHLGKPHCCFFMLRMGSV